MNKKLEMLQQALAAAIESGNDNMVAAIRQKLYEMAKTSWYPSIGVGGGGGGMSPALTIAQAVIPKPRTLEEKLCARMDWHTLQNAPFHIHIYASGGPVHIFIVKDGQCTVLQDEGPLFPCDELITKLRLLGGSDG